MFKYVDEQGVEKRVSCLGAGVGSGCELYNMYSWELNSAGRATQTLSPEPSLQFPLNVPLTHEGRLLIVSSLTVSAS